MKTIQALTANEVIAYMETLHNEVQRRQLMRFFKTGKGEYGEGDEFLGLKNPQTRKVVKTVRDLPLSEVPELLMSHWHEVRLCGFLLLVDKFERLTTKKQINNPEAIHQRDEIVQMYLRYARRANNWDLVDLSAPKVIGHWLLLPTFLGGKAEEAPSLHEDYKLATLDRLADSDCLWEQRISMVSTWKINQMGNPSYCLRYAEHHLHHKHDLMHKATGWMLREMGKRCSMDLLRSFLAHYAHEMPRTMLRYAIEKMNDEERRYWMNLKLPTNHIMG